MKYFAKQTRPAKFEDGKFKFRKRIVFEVESLKAYDMYVEASENSDRLLYEEIDWRFETGQTVRVDKGASVVMWGEEITNEELFKRRLKGSIGQEIIK